MLRISKLTDYAIIILSYLMQGAEQVASATHIAHKTHLGIPTVSKILKILTEATLVKSFRGTGGGYQLARSADQITIAEVISAIEGRVAITECCSVSNTCTLDSLCAIKENWRSINKVIFNVLSGFTLADMTKPLQAQALGGIPIKVTAKELTHGK